MVPVASQCPVCSPIISYRHNPLKPDITVWGLGRPPQSDLGAMQQGFNNGCEACGIIHATVTQFFQDHQVGFSVTSQTVVVARKEPLRKSILELRVQNVFLDIFTEEGESTLQFALGQLRPPIIDHSSSELDRFIEKSERTCSSNHRRCGPSYPVPLPKRLTNVGSSDQPPFPHITSKDELGQYACLSHCWGYPNYTLRTLDGNRRDYTREIPLAKMPRTFREALFLTRRIGLHYLWIDSLCIVQDDKQDWASEPGNMAQIYAKSWITMAAVHAADSREGLFPSVSREQGKTSVVNWQFPTGQTCRVYVCQSDAEYLQNWRGYRTFQQVQNTASEIAVLLNRAWTLQEALLPSRLLMFTQKGPIWTCNESFHPATDSESFAWNPHYKGMYQSLLSESAPGTSIGRQTNICTELYQGTIGMPVIGSGNPLANYVDGWVNLVEMYTARHLTFRSDLLRALAGLAQQYQRNVQVDYAAGLWDDKACLPYLLAWDVHPTQRP